MSFIGEFYIGVDLGKKRDYTAVAILAKENDKLKLVFMKRFKLGTEYASVIGYLKVLSEKLKKIEKIVVDQTGAEYFVEDLQKTVNAPVEGVILTMPKKAEVMGNLKTLMENKRLAIPYDAELIAELNAERFELTKSGQIQFSHPEGTHDDRLWALALAAYGAERLKETEKAQSKVEPVTVSF
jgi:phage FluMu gp28-like protein